MEVTDAATPVSTPDVTTEDIVPLKTVWRPKRDNYAAVRAVPPWADANAQPPPPLTSHYALWSPGPHVNKISVKKNTARQFSPDLSRKMKDRTDTSDSEITTSGQTARDSSQPASLSQSSSGSTSDQKCNTSEMVVMKGVTDTELSAKKNVTHQQGQSPPWRKVEPAKNTHSVGVPWRAPAVESNSTMVSSSVATSEVQQSSESHSLQTTTVQAHSLQTFQLQTTTQTEQEQVVSQVKKQEPVQEAPWRSPRTGRKVDKVTKTTVSASQTQPSWRSTKNTATSQKETSVVATQSINAVPQSTCVDTHVPGPTTCTVTNLPTQQPPATTTVKTTAPVVNASSVTTSTSTSAQVVTTEQKKVTESLAKKGTPPKGSPVLSRKAAPLPKEAQVTEPQQSTVPSAMTTTVASVPTPITQNVPIATTTSLPTQVNVVATANVAATTETKDIITKTDIKEGKPQESEVKANPATQDVPHTKQDAPESTKSDIVTAQSSLLLLTSVTHETLQSSEVEVKTSSTDASIIKQEDLKEAQKDSMVSPPSDLPPPPVLEATAEVITDSELLPPPPPALLQPEPELVSIPPHTLHLGPPTREDKLSDGASEEERPFEKDSPEYIPEPITTRIKKFEKQQSRDREDHSRERQAPAARPVGPWVKKTSSGPCRYEDWGSQAAEESDWPDSPDDQTVGPGARVQNRDGGISSVTMVLSQPTKDKSTKSSKKQDKSQGRPQVKQQHHQVAAPTPTPPPPPPSDHPRERPRTLTTSGDSGEIDVNYIADKPVTMPGNEPCPLPSPATAAPPTKMNEDPLFDPWCDPANPRSVQIQDVIAAAFKIKSGIMNTPCTKSHMSSITDMEIFFKKEFNQFTGSFKERGARYTLLRLSDEQKKKGVIAASAGNHALALSYHGQDLNIPVTVVMPLVAPIMKVQACKQYGANIIVRGNDIGECREIALKMSKEEDLMYINGYDHPHVIAGQGTMGLEIVEQVENIDAVVVPVGGAGLIAGVALAVKAFYPAIKVIGVESERCASFSAAMNAGSPSFVKAESTLADGLAVPTVGVNAFATAQPLIDKVVTVREEWIAIAILRLVELEKAVVEGAGATALAAILAGELPELKGKRVVIPLCGGNIDTTILGRCLERGLAADGRLVKFTVTVSDRPGGIAELTRLLASLGVSIKDMVHERAWIKSDIFSVQVNCVCELKDQDHFFLLKNSLKKNYKQVNFPSQEQLATTTQRFY